MKRFILFMVFLGTLSAFIGCFEGENYSRCVGCIESNDTINQNAPHLTELDEASSSSSIPMSKPKL